jgi:ribosomal protein S18 acetylase RimI-like enzyme
MHKFRAKDGRTVWLRRAVEDDAEALIRAADGVAREGRYFVRSRFEMEVERERAFIARAKERGDLILVALRDVPPGELVGWVMLLRARREFLRHTAELHMAVIRGYRGLGIGAALMDFALKWAAEHDLEKVNLGVRASNKRARTLYRKFGFVEEGYRLREVKDQHGRYDDNVEMACFLAPSSPLPGGEKKDGTEELEGA